MTLAEKFNGEIINGDALQMYEGLPITTNKIPVAERKNVPHHLLGCVKLSEEPWTVRHFCERAKHMIKEIRAAGKLPILVGGTHYYTQSLLFRGEMCEHPDESEHLDQEEQEQKWPMLGADTATMLTELYKLDPGTAQRWHPQDRRRIRNSLLVILQAGNGACQSREAGEMAADKRFLGGWDIRSHPASEESEEIEPLIFWTQSNQDKLVQRLNQRVDQMVVDGLLDEVKDLHGFAQLQEAAGATIDHTRGIWIAIGYKEFLPFVSGSSHSDAAKKHGIELTKIATRQYAKRQARWVRLTLLPAVKQRGYDDRFFLLDTTDLNRFSVDAEQPAIAITDAFLNGRALPDPSGLSDLSRLVLSTTRDKEPAKTRYCEACARTMMYQKQWDDHVRSKGHKKTVRPKVDWEKLYPKR